MNILLLSTHLEPGGVSSYVVSLAEGLKKKGHNVNVASSGGRLTDILKNAGIEHIRINIRTKSELSPKILFSFLKLKPIVRERNIQIIHAQTRVVQVLAFWLSIFSRIPFVSTCHGFFRPRFFRRLFPLWGKSVIAISDAVQEHLKRDFKISSKKIMLVYNGVDAGLYRVTDEAKIRFFREQIGLQAGLTIGIIARLSDVKGHKYLIEAFEKVLPLNRALQLLIIGDGKMKLDLVALTKKLGIEKHVFFIPTVIDIALALSAIDIFVMPSLQEGLGLSIMQAQAAGKPVIATSVGGIRALIKDQETGLLVPPHDAVAIAQSLMYLMSNKEFANSLGENARRNIEENFSVEKMAEQTEAFYRGI